MPIAPPLAPPPPLRAATHSLLLDFDGTLVELADRPESVVVEPALSNLLRRLAGTFQGRIALVSGRSAAQLEGFLGETLADIAMVGSHGAEVQTGSGHTAPIRPPALIEAEHAVRAMFAGWEGVVVEIKTLGVAVHYRLAPAAEPEARALIQRLARDDGLAVQEGKMMIELRTAGHDKGSGITALMAHAPFTGSVPVFAGDDVTDEAGFVAVEALGGLGVLVGPERETAAGYRLDDVAAVHAWLEQAA
ncbi:trehalose-phosphatase [Sphingomonas sp. M1-B02]|uniref:trehalose-phosphatase n=1 Tax=Sphingomonas sp. M1-B02 TaxID=3114300 RepID=UPI0022400FC8|nr:trehalose-phosphatase [Sphingomonas sp. S6-11]UZK65937.1 trehalose-phosphatase [Sphingomonas sp. S6-11]